MNVFPSFKINETVLENAESFPYLRSILSSTVARYACGRIHERVFEERDIHIETKVNIYKRVVLPSLLYDFESWITYRRDLKALKKYLQRYLGRILGISWTNLRINTTVLEEANCSNVEAMVVQNQLRCSGRVFRMDSSRLPKLW